LTRGSTSENTAVLSRQPTGCGGARRQYN